jgi:hypothetical protein
VEDSSDAYDDNRHDGQAVDTVPMDNQWAFGKWFYGPSLDANDMMSPALCRGQKSSRQLPAAQVVELALEGKKREVLKLMSLKG